jgi:hypothetical protein
LVDHLIGHAAGMLAAPEAAAAIQQLCTLPALIRSLIPQTAKIIPRIFRIMDPVPVPHCAGMALRVSRAGCAPVTSVSVFAMCVLPALAS